MNKDFKKMSLLLSGMLAATSFGIYSSYRIPEELPPVVIPTSAEPLIPPELNTDTGAQNPEEIDIDPTVEGTYDIFTITHYCGCDICNGDWGAYDALDEPLAVGTVACNVLPLGTIIYIDGIEYMVRDRLSSAYDGENRIDIYVEDHQEALDLGIRYDVEVFIPAN